MKRVLGALLACLAGFGAMPARAAEPDIAYGAYQTGFYIRALSEALKRVEADASDAAAMTLIGEIYRQGLGRRPDQAIATDWYEKASARGDLNATYALAMALIDGRGTVRNIQRGAALLDEAAEAGHAEASYNRALLLLGEGTETAGRRAVRLLESAAGREVAEAQYSLAILARDGRFVPKDAEKAADMMSRAAGNGMLAAEVELAIMVFNGDGVGRDEKVAADLFRRAAARGSPIAQNRLAKLHVVGRGGVPKSEVEAAAWHLAARAQGLADAELDEIFKRLPSEQRDTAARRAADRIERSALTSPTAASK